MKQEYMKDRTDFDELENLSLKDVESHRNIKAVNSTKKYIVFSIDYFRTKLCSSS